MAFAHSGGAQGSGAVALDHLHHLLHASPSDTWWDHNNIAYSAYPSTANVSKCHATLQGGYADLGGGDYGANGDYGAFDPQQANVSGDGQANVYDPGVGGFNQVSIAVCMCDL